MMVIKHMNVAPQHIRDAIGAAQVVLSERGVSIGRVAAVQLLPSGGADLVIEYDAPAIAVPDLICDRIGACRFDLRCPWVVSCQAHEHGPDCGGCDAG